ncbi:MAG: hypothetical protein H0U30_07865 [Actinobacteria bacterium]|nr:hypothetical protein [Actinomycetota bacterium]
MPAVQELVDVEISLALDVALVQFDARAKVLGHTFQLLVRHARQLRRGRTGVRGDR